MIKFNHHEMKYDIVTENLEAASFRALHAGDDYAHRFFAIRNGVPLSLANAIVWLTIKEESIQNDANALLQIKTPTDIQIVDDVGGEFLVLFKNGATDGLEGEWYYDIQARLDCGAIITLARGKIEFLRNVTRAVS